MTGKTRDFEGVFGGARRNRTDDLFNAIEALSQLSYGPTFCRSCTLLPPTLSSLAGLDPLGWIVNRLCVFKDTILAASPVGGLVTQEHPGHNPACALFARRVEVFEKPDRPASARPDSGLFVVGEIAVDQACDVIRIAFLFLKEGFVGAIILDLDVVIGHHGLFITRLRLLE